MKNKTEYEVRLKCVQGLIEKAAESLLHDEGVDWTVAEKLASDILQELGLGPKEKRRIVYIPETRWVKGKGHEVCFVTENEAGYGVTGGDKEPWYFGDPVNASRSLKLAKKQAAEYNKKLGHTEEDVDEILVSSMRLGSIQ